MYMTNSTKPKHSIIRVQGCKAILPDPPDFFYRTDGG
jgi:hypothetical protein